MAAVSAPPVAAEGTIPRCVRCLTFWRPDANAGSLFDGYYVRAGKTYCADGRACQHRQDVAAALAKLVSYAA